MKRIVAVLITLSAELSGLGAARAEWAVGFGGEHMKWQETTNPTVKETGLRLALDLTWIQSRQPGFSAGYNGKLVVGNVDYDGALLFTGTPISGETHYRGIANEAQVFYRLARNPVDFFGALGWDRWTRDLSVAQRETYDVLYARLGVAINSAARAGIIGSLGVKYPLWVRENAHLTDIGFDRNPRLHPGRQLSLYGTAGYRFNPSWDLVAYYDSYRFRQSDVETVTSAAGTGGMFQPETRMDLVGVKLQLHF